MKKHEGSVIEFSEVNLWVMDILTTMKLLFGPVRPFVFGKMRDALRRSYRLMTLNKSVPFSDVKLLSIKRNVVQIPSAQWMSAHGMEVLTFARNASEGKVHAYGIDTWTLGNSLDHIPDFRSVLELTRMHHWCAYALASHIDSDNKQQWYSIFSREVTAFSNLYRTAGGPMWKVAMDVGIRLHSLLLACDWFSQAGIHENSMDEVVASLASDHGYIIDARLERSGGMSTSHYLGNLLGFLGIGAYASGDEKLTAFARFAAAEIRTEIENQILGDGLNFEASVAYHRHVVDILIRASRLLLEQPFEHKALDEVWWTRLSKSIYALRVMESIGMPLIGDNDDGMAVKLLGYSADTSAMFDEAARFEPLQSSLTKPITKQTSFPQFGLWIFSANNTVLTARCGSNGQYGKGGHAHNDKNSITFLMNSEPVIVDSGSCWYSGDSNRRNNDRSINAHATLVINNREQSRFLTGAGENLWWMFDEPPFSVIADRRTWKGTVGLGRNRHIRTITIEESTVIHDEIPKSENGRVVIPLGHTINADISDAFIKLRGNSSTVLIRWTDADASIVPIEIAPAFAVTMPSKAIILSMRKSEITWTITPIFESDET